MEIPDGRHPSADDMDVRWPMIIRIDDDPEPVNSVDCRHTILYTKPKRLGIIILPVVVLDMRGLGEGHSWAGPPLRCDDLFRQLRHNDGGRRLRLADTSHMLWYIPMFHPS
jgi:hypothetical protein